MVCPASRNHRLGVPVVPRLLCALVLCATLPFAEVSVRTLQLVRPWLPLLCLAWIAGCAVVRPPVRAAANGEPKLNCASCKRACELAGDARDQGEAVDACKADCQRRCR